MSRKIFLETFYFEKYLRILCTFSPFYMPTVQHCQVFRTLNAELLYFWKIHTRLVPFTECNDNFDIRYFKREQQRVLKKSNSGILNGNAQYLEIFFREIEAILKKKWYSNFTKKNPIFLKCLRLNYWNDMILKPMIKIIELFFI